MKRSKHPSKIYSYGAKEPTENLGLVLDQMRKANHYRNKLVELELDRRQRCNALMVSMYPELASVEARIQELTDQKDAIQATLKRQNAVARSRVSVRNEQSRQQIKAINDALKPLRQQRAAFRKQAFDDETFQAANSTIWNEYYDSIRDARAHCGVYWGTYLVVEKSFEQIRKERNPRFRGFRGKGKTAVQIQKGMAAEDALLCRDNRIQIVGGYKAILSFRIGSDGRNPIWAKVPFTMHRDLPPRSQIKWVYLARTKVATHFHWEVQFVVESEDGWPLPQPSKETSVGIDMGWRIVPDGLRVAAWEDGKGNHGYLTIPKSILKKWEKPDELRSLRDRLFNEILAVLRDWMGDAVCPEWFTERTRTMHNWRSQNRLAGLVLYWHANRFPGDTEIFDRLEAWRKQDKHLYEWEDNQRKKINNWRDDFQRKFAYQMASRYETICVENCDWRKMAQKPDPTQEDQQTSRMRQLSRFAAPGQLRRFLKEKANVLRECPAEDTTLTCSYCGSQEDFNHAEELEHTCSKCGQTWDQDHNAARNLLQGLQQACSVAL